MFQSHDRRSARVNLLVNFRIEALEKRMLLSAKWGVFADMIGQNKLVSRDPGLNGAGESIAILDTGINWKDPLLGGGTGRRAKVIAGYDFVNNTNTIPLDPDGHGTVVAGIIAANPFAYGRRIYEGIAPDVHLIDLRIDNGDAAGPSDATMAAALNWVIAHRVRYNIVAVNLSEGGDTVYSHPGTYGPEAGPLATLVSDGVLVAVASGNDSTDTGVEYPAADPNAVAVGAVDSNDNIASFTSRGPNVLDLLAPGENVTSTGVNEKDGLPYIGTTNSGTSFAAPYVAATAALMKQADPSITESQELQIMQNTGVSVTDSADGSVYSRLNLAAAVSAAITDAVVPESVVAQPTPGFSFSGDVSAGSSQVPSNGLFSDTPILS